MWPYLATVSVLTVVLLCQTGFSIGQFADDKVYMGKSLGKFSTYHHQVAGEVYALDDVTLFIKGFTYDGNGPDAFFWAGSTTRPGNEGFLVPNERNRTNVLEAYHNVDVAIVLPEGKKINEIRWLSVFDLSLGVTYGDILIGEGFEPPRPQELVELSREAHDVRSKPVVIVNTKTLSIPGLYYDGKAPDARFWAGTGTQVTPNGKIIPDENGYLGPLRTYTGEDVTLHLPGNMTIFDIEWLSIYDTKFRENFGSISIRGELNIPLARARVIPNENRLPNCEQLHARLQVSWEVFGSKITVQLAADIGDNDYVAFGISGAENGTSMIGADVIIAYMEGQLGHVIDYNMTDKASCTPGTSGSLLGVCPDTSVGGLLDASIETFARDDGITKITYVRLLTPADPADKLIDDRENFIVWALGPLTKGKKPQFHYHFSKDDTKINFARTQHQKNCFYFTREQRQPVVPWTPVRMPADVVNFTAMLGPPGNDKGFRGMTGQNGSGLVWYINGYMAPDIYVKRGQRYNFMVYGGNDPHRPQFYHPFYITNDPRGGYEDMTPQERKKVRVYAGLDFNRRGPIPTAVGKLCWWKNDSLDMRRTDSFLTFSRFRNNLQLFCEEGNPAVLTWFPNSSTPDVVYYQSFRQANMGWRIIVSETIQISSAAVNFINYNILLSFIFALLIHWRLRISNV